MNNNTMTCSKCKESFPLTDEFFYKQKTTVEGIVSYKYKLPCKECSKKKQLEYSRNPDNMKIQKVRHAKWHKKNKDKEAENKRRLVGNNPEHYKKYRQEYRRLNPDKMKGYREERAAHKSHSITKDEWELCKSYFDYSCAYCGLDEMKAKEMYGNVLHREHVIHEGRNDLKNCVPSCKSCNSQKSMYTLNKWYNSNNPKYDYARYHKIYLWLKQDHKIARQQRINIAI